MVVDAAKARRRVNAVTWKLKLGRCTATNNRPAVKQITKHSLASTFRSWPLLAALALVALPPYSMADDAAIEACVKRGIEYFKEIGSYPTLSSAPNKGRKAEDVARERCERTTTAF
tara:strand:+ start:418 stop:765 length:348 start_codon:yes stop_codon:yes gene_type:complete